MTRPTLGLLLALALLVLTAILYGDLPAPPTAESLLFGEEVGPGLFAEPGAFLGPGLLLGIWLVLWFFPRVDPWREGGREGGRTYWIIGNLVLLVIGVVHLLMLGLSVGWPVDVSWLVVVIPGLFLLAVGSYLPTVPVRWPLGVRTPWTLRSEVVWEATHRLAGRTFVVGGLILLGAVTLAVEYRLWAAIIGLTIAGGLPALYSFILSRRGRG